MNKNNIKLEKSIWKSFKLTDIFVIEKGERLTEANRISGETPLITASSYNNGIACFIDKNSFKNKKSLFHKKITIDMFGNVFYHNYHYFSDDNIHTLIFNEELKIDFNDYICIFLVAILKKISSKYGFGRQVRLHRLNKEIISLPADSKGHPDWEFMSKYIYNQSKNITYDNPVIYPKNRKTLNNVNQQEFKVSDLFYIVGTKTTPKTTLKEYGDGRYPYITTRATNNGIDGFYDYHTEKGNVLIIDSATIGHTTYQESDFSASDHTEKLIPICSENFNKYIALFFKTILNKEQYRYGYGRKFNQTRIKETIIKLPIKDKDQPDWKFMEDYIKSLPYSKSL